MARPRTRGQRLRNTEGFTHDKAVQLIVRYDFFRSGYGNNLTPEVLAEMKRDWQEHRDEVLKVAAESFPGQSIWAQQEFDEQ